MTQVKLTPIRPVVSGSLQTAVERFATANSVDTTAAVRILLTEALTVRKFIPKETMLK